MKIGEAAKLAGVAERTLRYYESIGLVAPGRHPNGYRDYAEADVEKLRFVARARGLGFSVEDCRTLLSLYDDQGRASADVRAVAKANLAQVEAKIAELEGMKRTLSHLVEACAGDDRPNCPILDDLARGVTRGAITG